MERIKTNSIIEFLKAFFGNDESYMDSNDINIDKKDKELLEKLSESANRYEKSLTKEEETKNTKTKPESFGKEVKVRKSKLTIEKSEGLNREER